MSELETLKKTLVNIISSLQDYVSQQASSQNTLEPEPKILKKTP